jgi:hypothetical protein
MGAGHTAQTEKQALKVPLLFDDAGKNDLQELCGKPRKDTNHQYAIAENFLNVSHESFLLCTV